MLSFATVFPVLALIASLPKCVGSAMDVSQPRRTYAPLSDAGVAHPSPTPMVDFGGVDMELARRADGFTLGFGTCGYYYDGMSYTHPSNSNRLPVRADKTFAALL